MGPPKKTFISFTAAVGLFAIAVQLFLKTTPVITFQDLNAPKQKISEDTVVPSRSSAFPSNLIREGDLNEIGQRPIDNSIKVTFTLHANGDGTGEGIKIETLTDGINEIDDIINKHCCNLMKMDHARCEPNSGARLISDTGVRMLSFNDVEDGQRVYCVPQGVHFVWPLIHTGFEFYPKNVIGPIPGKPVKMKQLSQSPRVFSVDNFVSPEEVEELLRSNKNRMTPSEVGFGGWQDDTRTSSTSWDFSSKAAKTIQTRTFQILGMDVEPEIADAMQVLRYEPTSKNGAPHGEWYKPHVDWFNKDGYDGHDPTVNNGTNRFATMFLYLSDVEEGGATLFPLSTTHEGYKGEYLVHEGTVNTPGYINTDEARKLCNDSSPALKSRPKQGNAVLFYSQGPEGKLDPYSLHGGCPPVKGTKWSANVWVWNRKRPDKSKAKDNRGKKKDPTSIPIAFKNLGKTPLKVFWDSHAPTENLSVEYFNEEYQQMLKDKTDRFVDQGTANPNVEYPINSYRGHVFILVNNVNQVVHYAVVRDPESSTASEKGEVGQLELIK